MITGKYPSLRLRRNRKAEWTRRLVEESSLSSNDLILPIFLIDGKNRILSIKRPDQKKHTNFPVISKQDRIIVNKL